MAQEYLYESLYSNIKGMLANKERSLGISKVKLDKSDSDAETQTSDSNYNNGKITLDDEFCRRLIFDLEQEVNKSFPNQSRLKSYLTKNLRKQVKTGNDDELRKAVDKLRDVILKEKVKFFDSLEKRIKKVLINKY